MNKRVYRQDMIAGVVIILIGLAAFILALGMPGKAPMFPKLVSCGLMIMGALMVVFSIRKIKKDTPTEEKAANLDEFKSPVIVLALLILYVLAVIYIGFYISTPIMLVGYMWFMGIRNKKTILVTTVIVMAFVYCLFTLQLGVPLPKGILG
jgi:hypothetical protein